MVCHYCGYEIPIPKKCPKCESKLIGSFKAGTEQIENEIKRMFPDVGVVRMDADTTSRKGDYERILREFKSGKAYGKYHVSASSLIINVTYTI